MGRKNSLLKRANYWITDYFSVIKQGFNIINRDNINLLASGMVYSTLIAIVPCITFLSAFLSAFGSLEPFLSVLSEWVCTVMGDETGSSVMNGIVKFTGSAMSLGVAGLVSFIITGMFLVNKIYSLVNHIFRTDPSEGTMKRLILIVIFIIVLTVAITFAFSITSTLHDKVYSLMGVTVENSVMREHLSTFVRFLVVFFVYFFIIITVPNARIRPSASISGAVLGTLLSYLATFIFTKVIAYTVGYSVIYGSMASILFVLLYLYIIWYTVVFVMEVTYIYQFRPDRNSIIGRSERGDRQISDAIDVMVEIAKRFEEGKGSTSVKDLGATLSIPLNQIISALDDLESASLLIPVNVGNSLYMLSRPSERIKVVDIINSVFYSYDEKSRRREGRKGKMIAKEFYVKGINDENRTLFDLVKDLIDDNKQK